MPQKPLISLNIAFLSIFSVFFFCALSIESNSTEAQAALPPLLQFSDGKPVKNLSEWNKRRKEISELMIKYFIGSFPKKTPAIHASQVISDLQMDNGTRKRRIRVTYDTPNKKSLEMEVWTPKKNGPSPLIIIAPRFYQIYWAEDALERGYTVCLFPGVDSHHREKDFPGYDSVWKDFQSDYPKSNWTEISTKAWLASRCIDYLTSKIFEGEVDENKISMIGFSRYGKQAMIAAAYDERISCVVARSPGSPASSPYRYTSRNTFAEDPSDFPSQWFLPSLKNYAGRENEIPIDAHGWYALIAPRHCLIHTAHNDGAEPTFAVEKAYIEGRSVYRFLKSANNLRIDYRTGGHSSGPPPENINSFERRRNLDWIDHCFGLQSFDINKKFPEKLIHEFNWESWSKKQNKASLKINHSAPITEKIKWVLGNEPSKLPSTKKDIYLSKEESDLMTHDRWTPNGVTRVPIHFGAGVKGNLFYKKGDGKPKPVVIWLHPLSYHSGYNEGYGVQGTTIYHRLAENGFAVIAYDQCGFGLRLLEGRDFYNNHPQWSKLGRMVKDARDAISFVLDPKKATQDNVPAMDSKKIFFLGYSTGSLTALYTGAIDNRVTGIACFSGLNPLRGTEEILSTGGSRRLWELHNLLPKLGFFEGDESSIPFDYDDIIKEVSPRHCLIVTPNKDRFTDHRYLKSILNNIRSQNFEWKETNDVNRFQKEQHQIFLNWFSSLNK